MVTIKRTAMQAALFATAAAIGLGSHAAAQTIQGGFEFRVSNIVSPSQPTATVEVWAWFDNVPGVSEVFGGTNFDVVASDGDWSSNFFFPLGQTEPPPFVGGSSINGVVAGQLHLPQLGIFGDLSNPIWIFAAEWSTTDFTPRSVSLGTANTRNFVVAAWQTGALFQVWPNVIPGSGSITIVPASSLLVFPASAFAMAQRRRRRA